MINETAQELNTIEASLTRVEAARLRYVKTIVKWSRFGQFGADRLAEVRADYPALYNQVTNEDFYYE